MNLKKFQKLLDIYGSDLSAWPEKVRAEAAGLLAQDSGAWKTLNQAREFDRLIARHLAGEAPGKVSDAAAAARMMARLAIQPLPAQREQPARWQRVFIEWTLFDSDFTLAWPRIAALACAAALGMTVGILGAQKQAVQDAGRVTVSLDAADGDVNALLFETETPL